MGAHLTRFQGQPGPGTYGSLRAGGATPGGHVRWRPGLA